MSGRDTQKAITTASHAFTSWSLQTASDRSKLLRNWFNMLIEHKDDLAKLMVLEQGKPLAEAAGEIVYGAGFVEYYAEEGKRVYGDIIPSPLAEKRMLVLKQPVGVVGAHNAPEFPSSHDHSQGGTSVSSRMHCDNEAFLADSIDGISCRRACTSSGHPSRCD